MSINLLITGADGFIGRNLISYIKNNSKNIVLRTYTKKNNFKQLKEAIFWSEIIIHLAGKIDQIEKIFIRIILIYLKKLVT